LPKRLNDLLKTLGELAKEVDHLSWIFGLIVSLPSPWRAEHIRDIRVGVAFDVLNAVSGTASGVFRQGRLGLCLLTGLRALRPRYFPHLHSAPVVDKGG
jgi:hypothetical protein